MAAHAARGLLLFAACAAPLACASAAFATSAHAPSATAADPPGAGTAAPLLAPQPYTTRLQVSASPTRCRPRLSRLRSLGQRCHPASGPQDARPVRRDRRTQGVAAHR